MNTTRLQPVRSTRFEQIGQFRGAAVLLGVLLLTGVALWQFGTVASRSAVPYAAPALELMLTGAVPANLSFDFSDLTNADVTTAGFRFATFEASPLTFRLEFQGIAETGSSAVYLLSTGTYPLTLTLLENGRAYRTFTAFEGTVSLGDDGGTVAAFLSDETGRQVFLSARFRRPDAS